MGAVVIETHFYEYVFFGYCYTCSVPIYGPKDRYQKSYDNNSIYFCCINGHSQHFIGPSEVDTLRESLRIEREAKERAQRNLNDKDTELQHERRSKAVIKGKYKAQKQRIKNGVCPCCKRSFENLARHMTTKHPRFNEDEDNT